MNESISVAVVQCAASERADENLGRAGAFVAEAAARGANVVLLPELFANRYFPRAPGPHVFALAEPAESCRAVHTMRLLARTHEVVIPVSFYERASQGGRDRYYNSVAVVDADGSVLGVYRKSHIPDGTGYEEKQCFSPGDTGFRVWPTRVGTLGVGICWDQWFPECARAMTLLGADVLLYPTTIGSEPVRTEIDTRDAWRRAMIGHAASNAVCVAAANRVGDEDGQRYYGSSFVCNARGDILAELGRDEEGVALAEIDLATVRAYREWLGVFADRRPDLYGALTKT
ncbi:MAG: N-carbamoylputrescine amidase [Caulobacteraceae bacterium]|nr:MAG: N-carbamoylputrescine amidase [Caulobacteraceae bacterium]